MIPLRVVGRVLRHLDEVDGCWISRYSVGSHGYAQVGWVDHGKTMMKLAHRVAYEVLVGPIPSDMTVDHICRQRKCINPDHLRLLTNVDNARSNGFAERTHCPSGHAYDEANTYRDPKGHRRCRECARALARLRAA